MPPKVAVSNAWPMRSGTERSDYAPLDRSGSLEGIGFVYFLGSPNGERIKIGWSKDETWKRLRTHSDGDAFGEGGDYTLLAVVRATKHAEGQLHSYFRRSLVAKKEVYSAESVVPYIAWLRDNYFVSTTRQEFDSEAGRAVIEPNAWLPDPGRTSDRRSELSLLSEMDPWSHLPSRVVTGDDYYTPRHIVECARAALGGVIDLDPASHVMANQLVQARRFFTRDQNGLIQPWAGHVYLNPPFSAWPEWVQKVLAEVSGGAVDAIVMLGATRTLTARYFEPLLRRSDAMCIISGRTPFWGMATDSDSPTDGHFLLYIGGDTERFRCSVAALGAAWSNVGVREAVA